MSAQFRHLLLTRFNIRTEFAPAAQRLEDGWIRSRLEPMRRFCIPSVSAQEVPIPWLVFFDAESPDWLKEEMAGVPGLTPVYLATAGTAAAMAEAVVATGLVDRPYLLTSRVDSDDALARTFTRTAQSAFAGQRREFVELPVGIQRYRGANYTRVWRSNPFLTLIEQVEPSRPVETVFCMSHAQVLRKASTTTLWRPPQWLQTLHETNNESVLAGGVLPGRAQASRRFACDWDQPQDPFVGRALVAGRVGGARVVRKSRSVLGQALGSRRGDRSG